MPRGFYPEPEYGGRYGGYGRYGYQPRSIADLITEGGRFQANAHLQSGDIWARAAESIGQQLSGALTQSAEKKALRKRDEAFLNAASSWDGKDPQELLGSLKMFRPEEAMEMAKGIIGFRNLQAAPNEPTRESVDAVGKGLARNSYDVFAQVYPVVKDVMRPGLQKYYGVKELPDEPTQELYETTRVLFGAAPMQKTVTTPGPAGPVERLVGEDELRAGVPVYQEPKEVKPDTRSVELQLADAAAKGDKATYDRLLKVKRDAAAAGRDPAAAPGLERVVTTDPATGKKVTTFVRPEEGATYDAPTGEARPATGQQRKALSFFNRGKEAQEIASALEEGETISPTALRYVPDVANFILSNPNQAYRQAQRAFTEARLRKESGATIKDDEYENDAITYFVQPGDSKETKAQKRAMRNAVLAGIAFESGDALREFYGPESEGMIEEYKRVSKRPSGGPPRIATDAEYAALPSGSEYIDPDGNVRKKR